MHALTLRHTLANTGLHLKLTALAIASRQRPHSNWVIGFRLAISNASNSNAKVNGFALAHGFGQAVAMFTAQAATTGAKQIK